MQAIAIILRGSWLLPANLLIQLRKLDRYSHSAVLLSDGRMVEASAIQNEVLVHRSPLRWCQYEKRLSLDHLPPSARETIAARGLALEGMCYDWRAGRSQALEGISPPEPDDPRRVICYESTARMLDGFMPFDRPLHLVDAWDLRRAWRSSRGVNTK